MTALRRPHRPHRAHPPRYLPLHRLPLPPLRGALRQLASFSRSLRLLRSFKFEQLAPAQFYGPLAQDTAALLTAAWLDTQPETNQPATNQHPLQGLRIIDVGGGPGYFHEAFAQAGATYVSVEPDVGEMAAAAIKVPTSIRADGQALPLRPGCADIVYSSNVAEHVPRPWQMAEEMLRVTRPGGLVVLSYTVWLGPFGGHETGLWPHYVGGHFARRRYERQHGHPPKNVFGRSLFAVSCAAGLRWASDAAARGHQVQVVPRYHPWWAWWVLKVPVLREFLASNLVVMVRKAGPQQAA